ncbi:hypothetical protein E4T40_03190 [Aureobasidium subglaciale]|nr:hypothetical protein E4T40_03190 [Aureobasidium subglaciale]
MEGACTSHNPAPPSEALSASKVSSECQERKARHLTSRQQRHHHLESSLTVLPPTTYSININMASQEEQPYRAKDSLGSAIKAAMVTTGAGLFVSTVQNTLTKQNHGAMGAFTKFGGTTAVYGAMGAAYEFTRCASANLRQRDDAWNSAWGGLAGGAMLGLRLRTAPAVAGYGTALAVILGTWHFAGGKITGYQVDDTVDEVARKEYLRKNRRRPMEETLQQVGEGRGIYGPGYPERRAERLQQNYGIQVPTAASS